ncbi:translation-associated GTPase, partial [Candidatus Woesearchaeota archaeon CG_4_10_14_0_8_um_filter_47_5]
KKEFPSYTIVPCSAESELALREAAKKGLITYIPGEKTFTIKEPDSLTEQQLAALAFIKKNMLEAHGSTGVQELVNTAVFDVLGYVAVFPGGVNKLTDQYGRVLPDCFLMPPGTTALDFAFRLHTDFGKHFIRAVDVRTKRAVGKEHVLKHRDVVEIVSGR